MLPSEIMIWQPEFTDKILSRKPGAVQPSVSSSVWSVLFFPATACYCGVCQLRYLLSVKSFMRRASIC
ncbi:hypothetical protein WQ92_15565 [Escherichia coli]|nr:hypothetical protein WQ92_15565 [Escherichia coli]